MILQYLKALRKSFILTLLVGCLTFGLNQEFLSTSIKLESLDLYRDTTLKKYFFRRLLIVSTDQKKIHHFSINIIYLRQRKINTKENNLIRQKKHTHTKTQIHITGSL